MDKNKIILNELVLERTRLVGEISKLNDELRIIQNLIDRRTKTETDSPTETYIKKNAVKPMQALVKLFSDNPNKPYMPSELKKELMSLKEQGLLITSSKNLLNVVHSSLKALVKPGFVVKNDLLNPPRYKLNENIKVEKGN